MNFNEARNIDAILGTSVDVVSLHEAIERVQTWAKSRTSQYVCFCNVHAVITARCDSLFARALSNAAIVAPDGAPIAWMLRRLGHGKQQRISGTDFFIDYCDRAQTTGESIYLLGSTPTTLTSLQNRLRRDFPKLHIAGANSIPFRALTFDEDRRIVEEINSSGAGTVWVSLGCPKQEIWMMIHLNDVNAVMLGVGAAFDFFAGTVPQAPRYLREHGFEWLFRLCAEPRRLWRRYLVTNTMFVLLAARQLLLRAVSRVTDS